MELELPARGVLMLFVWWWAHKVVWHLAVISRQLDFFQRQLDEELTGRRVRRQSALDRRVLRGRLSVAEQDGELSEVAE